MITNVWSNFSGRAVKTWDNQPLYYYQPGTTFGGASSSVEGLLANSTRTGQCMAFVQLLSQAWFVNGVTSWDLAEANPTLGSHWIMIKAWEFGPTNSNLGDFKWTLEVTAGESGNPEMVPIENISGTVTNAMGMAGQNTQNPSQKIFGKHYLVLQGNNLYDPSYGRIYTNASEFTLQNVEGYAKNLNITNGLLLLEVRKP